jgi:hypothetical protein
MILHGGGFPHFLTIIVAGFVWLLMLAALAALLYFVIRFAVLGALKAHTRWQREGEPSSRSAWAVAPAPHPGPGPGDASPAAQPTVTAPEPDIAATPAPPEPPAPPAVKPRTPRAKKP